MTRKVTWCAGSAIGFTSDVQPPFVKLYLSTFYPRVRRDLSLCTGGVSRVLLLINGASSNLPEADRRHSSFNERSSQRQSVLWHLLLCKCRTSAPAKPRWSRPLLFSLLDEIVGSLGEGTFGKVVECVDHAR